MEARGDSHEWHEELDRFRTIFRPRPWTVRPAVPALTVVHASPSPAATPGTSRLWDPESLPRMLYVAGNHDIGVGATTVRHAAERYARHIGPLNCAIDIAGVRIVAVDTLGIDNRSNLERAIVAEVLTARGSSLVVVFDPGTVLRGPPALESSPAYRELDRAFNRMRTTYGRSMVKAYG